MTDDNQQTPPESLIDYIDLLEQAQRHVVRLVLEDLAANGLPGQHYFYIAFRTDHPGVRIDDSLRAGHPEEMSIILQYQYDDLQVTHDYFEVTLHFSGIPHRLHVPWEAVIGFVDPYVSFGLQFQPRGVPAAPDSEHEQAREQAELASSGHEAEDGDGSETKDDDGSNVVSLDSFRRK